MIYDCNVNKLFTTLTHVLSIEGVSELAARVAGGAAFEVVDLVKALDDPTASSYKKAVQMGRVTSTALNYSIVE